MTTDFRMVWESLTTCPGTCSGCNIAEKTDLENGLWTPQQFEIASMHTKKLLKNGNHNNRQKLFLAAGDYLYLSEEKMKMVFARDWFSSPLSVAVARTSQSPFPLAVML